MDIRSLRYFVETVRLQSFTAAAESLHVTQSTISKMVRQLEQETGAQLLIRDGRQLALTDVGRVTCSDSAAAVKLCRRTVSTK